MTRHFADLIAMKTCMCLGLATGIMAVIGARSGLAERGRLMSGGSPLQASATPKATSVLPDLRFHTFVGGWPGWRYEDVYKRQGRGRAGGHVAALRPACHRADAPDAVDLTGADRKVIHVHPQLLLSLIHI